MAKHDHPSYHNNSSYNGATDFNKPPNLVNLEHSDRNIDDDSIDIDKLAANLHRTVINLDFAHARYFAAVREHDVAYSAWAAARINININNPSSATDH